MRGTGDHSQGQQDLYDPVLERSGKRETASQPMQPLDLAAPDLGGLQDMSNRPKRTHGTTRQANGGDALVFIAMGLVSAALGLGLYAHLGFQFSVALIAALGLFITTSFIHVFVRRMQGVDLLDRRVTALEGVVSQFDATSRSPEIETTIASSQLAIESRNEDPIDLQESVFAPTPELAPVVDSKRSDPFTNRAAEASATERDTFRPLQEVQPNEAAALEMGTSQQGREQSVGEPQANDAFAGFGRRSMRPETAAETDQGYTIPSDAGGMFGRTNAEVAPVLTSGNQRSIDGLVQQLEQDMGKRTQSAQSDPFEATQARSETATSNVHSADYRAATAAPISRTYTDPYAPITATDTRRVSGETPIASPFDTTSSERMQHQAAAPLDPLEQSIQSAADRGVIDIYLQPILSIEDRKVRFFEVLGRIQGPAGQVIAAEEHTDLSRSMGVLAALDQAILVRSARLLRKLAERRQAQPLFCNISRESLGDPNFMRKFVEYVGGFRDIAPYLIFEIEQSALTSVDANTDASIRALVSMGFRVSIDQVHNVEHALATAQQFDFSFLKLPFNTFLSGADQSDARARALAIHAAARDNGLTLVVDQIERKDQLAAVVGAGANLGQGYLFSEPKPLLPQVAAEVADATVAA